jgi:hypothetical protein
MGYAIAVGCTVVLVALIVGLVRLTRKLARQDKEEADGE